MPIIKLYQDCNDETKCFEAFHTIDNYVCFSIKDNTQDLVNIDLDTEDLIELIDDLSKILQKILENKNNYPLNELHKTTQRTD